MIFFQFWNHQILDFAKLIFSHGCLYSHDAVHKMKLRKEEKTRAADHFLILTIISQPRSRRISTIFSSKPRSFILPHRIPSVLFSSSMQPPPLQTWHPPEKCHYLDTWRGDVQLYIVHRWKLTVRFFQIFSRLIRFSSRFTSASFFISSSSSMSA